MRTSGPPPASPFVEDGRAGSFASRPSTFICVRQTVRCSVHCSPNTSLSAWRDETPRASATLAAGGISVYYPCHRSTRRCCASATLCMPRRRPRRLGLMSTVDVEDDTSHGRAPRLSCLAELRFAARNRFGARPHMRPGLTRLDNTSKTRTSSGGTFAALSKSRAPVPRVGSGPRIVHRPLRAPS